METFGLIVGLIVGLPITLLIAWLFGFGFRAGILKQNLDGEHGLGPKVVNILLGLVILFVLGIISNQLGCYGSDFESNSSFR